MSSNGEFINDLPNDPKNVQALAIWMRNLFAFLKRRESDVTGTYTVASITSIEVRNGVIIKIT